MALEAMFMKTSKPTQMDRKNLGEQLDMSPRAVQGSFCLLSRSKHLIESSSCVCKLASPLSSLSQFGFRIG